MRPIKLTTFAQYFETYVSSDAWVSEVCADTRHIGPGAVFVALRGQKVDGHDLLDEAAAKGAVAAIVQEGFSGSTGGMPLIRVADPLRALQDFAKRVLSERKQLVVGITGSLGKTTTKDWTAALLAPCYRVGATKGNWNTKVTLPLTILGMSGEEEVAVLEMGMSEKGDLSRLIEIAPPDIAILTSVSMMHIAYFESMDELAREKAKIFLHPRTSLGIIHREAHLFEEAWQTGGCPKQSFSDTTSHTDYYVRESAGGVEIYYRGEKVLQAQTSYIGRHNHKNLLAAVSIAHAMDVSWDVMGEIIPTLQLPDMRLQRVEKEGVIFINDAYKSSVDTVKAALEALPTAAQGGRRVAVLGAMGELGRFDVEQHALLGQVALDRVDHLICLGQRCAPALQVWEAARRPCEGFDELDALVAHLRAFLQPGDVVLVKGSRTMAMERIVDDW